ncbi:MAG: aryl-sulfate sulfotransferase [Dehalococcoidia bacterium]
MTWGWPSGFWVRVTLTILPVLALLTIGCDSAAQSTPNNPEPTETPVQTPTETPTEIPTEEPTSEPTPDDATPAEPAFEEPIEVQVVDSDITANVAGSGEYEPDSDTLIAYFNDGENASQNPRLYMISPDGEVTRTWEVANRHGTILGDRRVLANGNIMFIIWDDGVYEMTPDGEIVWSYLDDEITHHAEILPNGNVLLVGSECNCVREVDYETQEELWYWDARQSLPDYSSDEEFLGHEGFGIRSIYSHTYVEGQPWAHVNHAQVLPNDNVLVSLRNFDLVMEIERDGNVVWSFGPGIVKHQHTPRDLGDGTMLVYDNGNHRVILVDRGTQEILWEYDDLFAPIMGDVSLLEDGNYKVVDALDDAVKVVSPDEDLLWSIEIESETEYRGIYRAHMPGLED